MYLKFKSQEDLQMLSLCILSEFMSGEECRSLFRESPTVVPFALRACRDARSRPDHRASFSVASYCCTPLLKLLRILAEAEESVAERLVCEDGLAEISAAIQTDPNCCLQGVCLFLDVLYGTETLWHILNAEKEKHVPRVRSERSIFTGIQMNTPILFSVQHVTFV